MLRRYTKKQKREKKRKKRSTTEKKLIVLIRTNKKKTPPRLCIRSVTPPLSEAVFLPPPSFSPSPSPLERKKKKLHWYPFASLPPSACLTKPLPPPPAVKLLAQLAIVRHLAPAVAPPLAARHVHHKVAVLLVVEDTRIAGCVRAGTRGE